jgi:hypothetical protein
MQLTTSHKQKLRDITLYSRTCSAIILDMYLYHFIPEPFIGNSLIPLNNMDKSSELYKKNVQKYKDREDLLEIQVPILNCKWNDVVHFSAIDPILIAKEILKINPEQKFKKAQYFKIHVNQIINKYDAVVFDRPNRGDFGSQIGNNEFVELLQETYQELTSVRKSTIEYWKEAKEKNRPLLWFMHVPHVLVMGEVKTTEFEICELLIT